jgi:hypothetical protein
MIQFPRRSVTRFFIPLVDVMILLFSVFMLMPIVQRAAEGGQEGSERSAEDLRAEREAVERQIQKLERLRKEMKLHEEAARLREEVQHLRQEKLEVLQQRLAVRVLEIDPKTGELIAYEGGQPPRPVVIDSKQAAQALIRRQRRDIRPPQELYYLFLFPRVDSAFPEERQLQQYKQWFRDVPHGIDRPAAGRK